MSIICPAPFVGKDAFDIAAQAYVSFPTQSDAMLASLLLSHQVSYAAMSQILSLIKHPDFNHKEVSLNNAYDILQIAEEARVNERLTAVQKRSLNDEGHMVQTRFPQAILSVVLDILEQEREDTLFQQLYQDLEFRSEGWRAGNCGDRDDSLIKETFCSMSLVHRSWTHLAQKSLGRIIYPMRNCRLERSLNREYRGESSLAIYGPWTTSAVLVNANLEPWHIETLTTVLLRLPRKLDHLVLQTAKHEPPNKSVIEIDCLVDNSALSSGLQYLALRDAIYRGQSMCADFSSLRGLRIMCSSSETVRTFVALLSCISSNPVSPFNSLAILDINSDSISEMGRQELYKNCSSIWPRLRQLRLKTERDFEGYYTCEQDTEMFELIVARCTGLRKLAFNLNLATATQLSLQELHLPATIEELEVRFTAAEFNDYISSGSWEPVFLAELVDHVEREFPALRKVRLCCPHVPAPEGDMAEDFDENETYEDQIDEIDDEVGEELRSMGVDFSIAWYH